MGFPNLCVSRNAPSPPYERQVTQTMAAPVVRHKITQLSGYLLQFLSHNTQTHT